MKLSVFFFVTILAMSICQAQGRRPIKRQEQRKQKQRHRRAGSKSSDVQAELGPDECAICTPENKNRPVRLLVQYFSGPGNISKYQDEDKATCRDQTFPADGTVEAYDVTYAVADGAKFEIMAPGGRFDAETDFEFSNGIDCYIHTSCSQPLVAGDQIGPFLLLEGNECVYNPECICEATATYEESTGVVTIDYEFCDVEPLRYDFIGIYPCDAPVREATQEWWDSLCPTQLAACGEIQYGYEEGQVYVDQAPVWWTYTCGSPGLSNCQQNPATEWPSSGTVTIDPNVPGAAWAFGGVGTEREGRTLEPGCYKVLMNREMEFISAPPYPTICADWENAIEFQVP